MRQYFFFLSTLLRSRERVALELCSCKSLALCSTLIAFRRTGHGFFKLSWRSAQSQRICAHLQDSAPYMAMSLALRTHTLTHKREIRHNQITRPRHCKDIHHHHSYHSHHPSPPSLCDSSDSDLCPHTKPKATTFPGDRWQTPRMFFLNIDPADVALGHICFSSRIIFAHPCIYCLLVACHQMQIHLLNLILCIDCTPLTAAHKQCHVT